MQCYYTENGSSHKHVFMKDFTFSFTSFWFWLEYPPTSERAENLTSDIIHLPSPSMLTVSQVALVWHQVPLIAIGIPHDSVLASFGDNIPNVHNVKEEIV